MLLRSPFRGIDGRFHFNRILGVKTAAHLTWSIFKKIKGVVRKRVSECVFVCERERERERNERKRDFS